MSVSVKLGDSKQCALYYETSDGVGAIYVVEGSEADAKEAIPQMQLMTGIDGDWHFKRVAGSVKPDRRAKSS